jgi:hypothetical protein
MELCEGGDLQKVLDEKKGVGIGEELALKYFRQICSKNRYLYIYIYLKQISQPLSKCLAHKMSATEI